jgi:Phytanoyl-CoA dioxygenase (PhyH)
MSVEKIMVVSGNSVVMIDSLEKILSNWSEDITNSPQEKKLLMDAIKIFVEGFHSFEITGETPFEAYLSLRKLYCLTNGKLNDFVANLIGICYPEYSIEQVNSILGSSNNQLSTQIAQSVERDGFYKFDHKLPKQYCDQIRQFALTNPCKPNLDELPESGVLYDSKSAIAPIYRFDENLLLQNSLIQTIVTDMGFLSIAQAYLGCKPICDSVAMWWSTSHSRTNQDRSDAAQLYHFDMDRLKFIKFFIYLTDVTPETGPHSYIRGSHKHKPKMLLRDERISDTELYYYYSAEDFIEIIGDSGTVIAVDTRGFHKGKPLEKGERLIFEIEFSNSLFGAPHNKISLISQLDPGFRKALETYQYSYSRFESDAF